MTTRTSWWGKRSLWQRFVLLLIVLGIAAGVYFFLNRGPAPQPSIFRIASSGEGEATLVVEGNDPQWSPDGNSVLLTADDEEGVEGIYRLELDGGEPTFIATGGNPELVGGRCHDCIQPRGRRWCLRGVHHPRRRG